ncbi:MAG TPA: hypothetical protein VLA19_08065 [Herpetosiphonaceae bacterium]|nr:hypothetical protein [Herpetosiphonaceae bacterium]
MWTLADYQPVTLFSLKSAGATSSGGRTLLTPTAFSIKMALLDAALRTRGREIGQILWSEIRDLRISIALPAAIAVVNTFTKIVRPKKNGPSEDRGTGLITPFGSTIAYREYVHYGGVLGIGFQTAAGAALPPDLENLLPQVNYLGKRGSFLQLQAPPRMVQDDEVRDDTHWVLLTSDQTSFAMRGTLQLLDDCTPALTFQHADIYSGKRIMLGKERVLRHIVLPYELTRSSRSFSLYERII